METTLAPLTGRREASRQMRREAILDVAQNLFLNLGYAATAMSTIAAKLGGSKGTLWSYFPSKEQLFAAVLDRASAAFRQELSQALGQSEEIGESLTRFCRHFLGTICRTDAIALHRLISGEARRFPELGQIFYQRAVLRVREMLAARIAQAMDQGQLRRDDAADAAQLLSGLCISGSHQQLLLGVIPQATPRLIDQDVMRAIGLFLRAYAPGEPGINEAARRGRLRGDDTG